MDEEQKGHKKETYKVQIDKQKFETDNPTPTARELLTLAGKVPVEHFALYLKDKGQPKRLELDERVDLREPGVEKFVTLPLDQTEGLGAGRRQFSLPQEDEEWLESLGLIYELVAEGGTPRVIIYGWVLPAGYKVEKADINVRIDPGYPDAQIDMVYFSPALVRRDGRAIAATSDDSFDGKVWQRWSRHRTSANPWRPGLDSLSTHFALIDDWLARELRKG
ncbi:multiubiquitin domain-containing protein [Mesorhizobium helmanticense]|uniref:Multi-ubiquitin domain-containing protein n=1 Tax=Mesorhizobium helmanticense TaxID=1776423 RepID=A0A2T4IWM3_9HYPH|nr:multiubiquitin domain-containing protein [Mesorhizobium helmanticense]PTE10066.1 hypothetical protein C9427_13195 [Mesorhizobium helmanticense]